MDVNLTTGLLGLLGTAFVAILGFLGIMAKAWRDGSDSREERYDAGLWRQIDNLEKKATGLESELKNQKQEADTISDANFRLRQENLELKGQVAMAASLQLTTASELALARQEISRMVSDKDRQDQRLDILANRVEQLEPHETRGIPDGVVND